MRLIQTLALGLLCLFYTAVAVADYRDDIGFTRLHDEPGRSIAGGNGRASFERSFNHSLIFFKQSIYS